MDHCHKITFRHNGHQWGSRDGVGNKNGFTKRLHTRIHEIESGSECDSECSVTSDPEEHLEEEAEPTLAIVKMPENLRGRAFLEGSIRHYSSHVNIPNMSSETEIVHIGRMSQNECAVITMTGSRSQKALWDSGAGRYFISYDCYNSLHPKYKMGLFPSSVKIRATNGTFIAHKGECDITLKINNERFTFPFLCSDQLFQQMILGHNFSKAYHIGMPWNVNDVMSLTRHGIPFAESLPTNDINALVFCTESPVIPSYSNGYIKCRMP